MKINLMKTVLILGTLLAMLSFSVRNFNNPTDDSRTKLKGNVSKINKNQNEHAVTGEEVVTGHSGISCLGSVNNYGLATSLGSNHVYVCDDCGKVQVKESTPYDKSTCPETRWGGIGGAGNIFDDGDHSYHDLGYSGANQYVCSRCNIAIMLAEKPSYSGTCGASGSNCCNHRWE